MNDFLLIFRADYSKMLEAPTEQQQAMFQRWVDWIGGIAEQGHLVDRGQRLFPDGITVSDNDKVINGPYTEIKEFIGGYSIIRAQDLEQAATLVKNCPVYMLGGRVEIRQIRPM